MMQLYIFVLTLPGQSIEVKEGEIQSGYQPVSLPF